MQVEKKDLGKSQIELTITLTTEEIQPQIAKAIAVLGEKSNIPGFRPGHAPSDLVIKRHGEMAVYQEALPEIINHWFWKAIDQEKIEPAAKPELNVEKLAPGNDLVFKAVVALMPEVTVGDLTKLKVKKNEVSVDDSKAEKLIEELRNMQATEIITDRAAEVGDKVDIDFSISLGKVVIEGGSATHYHFKLGKGQMLPDFEAGVVGLKSGEEKEYEMTFPEDYHGANVAGKKVEVKVKLNQVWQIQPAEVTDEWAKKLGATSMDDLRSKIKNNLQQEEEQKEKERFENEILKSACELSTFDDLPESLVHEEAHRMVEELAQSVERQGLKFADYLIHLKKNEEELAHDFSSSAGQRIKTSILLKKVAIENALEPTESDVDVEWKKNMEGIQDKSQLDSLASPEYKKYLKAVLRNRKAIDWLVSKN